jgi:cytochrome c oxidase assembly factor CtaG
LLFVLVALQTPIDTWAETSFAVHMIQHLLLTMVAAPLLVLGAPIRLSLGAWPGAPRRRLVRVLKSRGVRLLSHPILGWAAFFAVMWGTHLSGVYEATLRSPAVHTAEHLAYLGTALMFWGPVVGVDPSPSRLSYPGRILYLFLAMPAMAFLGLAIYSAREVLYPTYAAVEGTARAITDQHVAGAVMWTGTMFLIVPALAFVLLDWMRSDDREAAREDARIAAAYPSAARGSGS